MVKEVSYTFFPFNAFLKHMYIPTERVGALHSDKSKMNEEVDSFVSEKVINLLLT